MEINKLNEHDLKTAYPNKERAILEKMSKKDKENYLKIYNLYRKLFTEYIIEKIDLKKYNKMLIESEVDFKETIEEDMDIYQYFSSKELKYFYIRNNIYIGRLEEKEKDFLKEKIEKEDYELDEESKKLIESTYKKVIFEGKVNDGKKYITLYGPNSSSFLAGSEAIVIGFRYDEFAEDGLNDEEWRMRHYKQMECINKTIYEMLKDNKEKNKDKIAVLKYSQFSIIKRKI